MKRQGKTEAYRKEYKKGGGVEAESPSLSTFFNHFVFLSILHLKGTGFFY
jgi:hypothetical protein